MDGPPIEDGAVLVRGHDHFAAVRALGRPAGGNSPARKSPSTWAKTPCCRASSMPTATSITPACAMRSCRRSEFHRNGSGRINAVKRSLDDNDYLARPLRAASSEYGRWGATTLLNVESFPELMWKLPAPTLRTWWFYEMIDVRQRHRDRSELVTGALLFFQEQLAESHPGWLGGRGLESTRALYRVSRDVPADPRLCHAQHGMPWTTHLGESRDEQEMFVHGRGPPLTISSRASGGRWTIAGRGNLRSPRSPPMVASGPGMHRRASQ